MDRQLSQNINTATPHADLRNLTASRPHPIQIESVRPTIDGGRYLVKREVGDSVDVSADVFRDGHDQIRVAVQYRPWYATEWRETRMEHQGNDYWAGSFIVDENTRYEFRLAAWPDQFGTWQDEVRRKQEAGLDLSTELLEGKNILKPLVEEDSSGVIRSVLSSADLPGRGVEPLLDPVVAELVDANLDRDAIAAASPTFEVVVDRIKARFAAWYEIFPRSAGTIDGVSGTFDDVIDRLDMIAGMGFDVLYFPPIHPIGEINRKGRNNAVVSQPGDPGSPYAIGSALGGHDAIEPGLGTLEDFHRLAEAARERGMEIALDFAIQVAPDHRWAEEHPSWFYIRPDGTIKYAENPPKKYEDIYPINFSGEDWFGLWRELRRVLLYWIDQGVTIFRVDNPHTKPFEFWEWVIREIQDIHPEAIFLSEAFTRPKVMKALAKVGFTQSYSYFTWRNDKQGLTDYFQELTSPPVSDYMRANLFPTTPDILPIYLQQGGPAAFKIRLTLATTLSSVYGMYGGYELCEGGGIPGKEEFINSEKYELKVWDWDRPGNIRPFVTRLNEIRRAHPALHEYDNLRFHWSVNDNILAYSKRDAATGDAILVVVNLDPFRAHESMMFVPPEDLMIDGNRPFTSLDLISGEQYQWQGGDHYVRLDPGIQPVHVFAFDQK